MCTDCKHGECIGPNRCKCSAGYFGPACDISKLKSSPHQHSRIDTNIEMIDNVFSPPFFCSGCTVGFWGKNCSHKCNCEHDSICDQFNGQCKCTKGYTGDQCELECPSDHYGLNCAEPCRCNNGGKCHHISGECTCAPGFTGPLCADVCPIGTHGEACKSKCKCQNGGECDPQTGKCQCPNGMLVILNIFAVEILGRSNE